MGTLVSSTSDQTLIPLQGDSFQPPDPQHLVLR